MRLPLHYVLTLGRLVLAAGFAACAGVAWRAAAGGPLTAGWLGPLLVLAVAVELTDFFDGIVARRSGQASRLGGLLDPLCDSLARLAMYFAAALAGWVSLAVPLVMVARDLVVAYVRTVVAHTGGRTAARFSGKAKAIAQAAGMLALLVLAAIGGPAAPAGRAVTAAFVIAVTAWSLIDYLRDGWSAVVALYRHPPA